MGVLLCDTGLILLYQLFSLCFLFCNYAISLGVIELPGCIFIPHPHGWVIIRKRFQ